MLTIRLHLSGGQVMALCKCAVCGEVNKYTIAEVVVAPVGCKRCGHLMDLKGAVIEAVDRTPDAKPPPG